MPGELVLADWPALKKIFTTALPLFRAGGKNRKLILSPLLRFINSKCFETETHITNFVGKTYAKGMGKQLAEIHGWLDDLAHGKRLQNYEFICPSFSIGLADNSTLKDRGEREKLRDRWGTETRRPEQKRLDRQPLGLKGRHKRPDEKLRKRWETSGLHRQSWKTPKALNNPHNIEWKIVTSSSLYEQCM